jgi:hypothetical protein
VSAASDIRIQYSSDRNLAVKNNVVVSTEHAWLVRLRHRSSTPCCGLFVMPRAISLQTGALDIFSARLDRNGA